jgi:hypothetical protein
MTMAAPSSRGAKAAKDSKRPASAPTTRKASASIGHVGHLVRFTRESMVGSRSVYVNPMNVLWVDAVPDPLDGSDGTSGSAIYVTGGTLLPLVVKEPIDEVVARLNGAIAS